MSDTDATFQRCRATRKDGTPCAGRALDHGFCFAHSPQSSEWRSNGGKATRKSERAMKLLPSRLQPIVDKLEQVFNELYEGVTEERVNEARAMATIAVSIGKLIQTGELEERTRELEKLAKEAAESRKWA